MTRTETNPAGIAPTADPPVADTKPAGIDQTADPPVAETNPAGIAPTADPPVAETNPAGIPPTGDQPEECLAAAFGARMARWAREQGASEIVSGIVRRAAMWVSRSTSNGHSCTALDEFAESLGGNGGTALDVAELRSVLMESQVVGSAQAPVPMPLIVDDQRLYLHRYFDYECRLARTLAARGVDRPDTPAASTLPANVAALLDRLYAANAAEPGTPDWQKIAAITALLGRLTIISGGPGTGKTTTIVNLLACLLEADPDCRIALTAPTGKAAARMLEVILQRTKHLPDALRAKLPTESSTIHRLLGGRPNGDFRHHAANELPIDVLVVDEASMLDLALAVHLIEAVPANARIILLGDKDQLAAVESGAVFSELSAHPTFSAQRIATLTRLGGLAPQTLQTWQHDPPPPPLQAPQHNVPPTLHASRQELPPTSDRRGSLEDCVIWLQHNYRFGAGSAIGLLAAEINDGDATRALARLEAASDRSLVWINDGGSAPSPQSVHAILGGYESYIEAVRSHTADPRAVTAAFARLRVLCAVRDGPWGVNAINQQISIHFRRALQHPLDPGIRSEWYPGRPVMVLRNEHVLKLFNGDIGIALPDAHGILQVWFTNESGGFRAIAPVRVPEHETAFAMTVHKAQGSEFEEILLVLPAEGNRILTRELLYTAVTRARERLCLVANATVIASAINAATRRVSGLLARLREEAVETAVRG